MVSFSQLQQQDIYATQNSILHNVDSRIKLLVLFLVILFAVSSSNFIVFLTLEI